MGQGRYAAVSITVLVLTLAGCRSTPSSVRIDPALYTIVPSDTVLIAGMRIDKLKETPAWQKHVASRPIPLLDDAARETGLDLRRNLWEVLLVSNGAQAVALARGKFGEQGMEPRVYGNARRSGYKGYTVLGTEQAAFAFLTTSTIAAGKPADVRWLIDARGNANGPSEPLKALISSIPYNRYAWMAAAGASEIPGATGNAANLSQILSMTQSAKVSAEVSEGIGIDAETVSRTAADARNLADSLRGLAAMARLGTRDKTVAQVFEGLQIGQQDRSVTLKLALTGEQLARLAR